MSSKKRAGDRVGSKGSAAAPAPAAAAPAAGNEEVQRMTKVVEAWSEQAPAKLAPHIKTAAPYLAMAVVYFNVALPHIVAAYKKAQALFAQLPEQALYAALGFLLCFFGGVFPATIAAVEAWRLCGGTEALEHCRELLREARKVQDASRADDEKDEDADGQSDVTQLAPKDLVQRKMRLALRTVDPQKVSGCLVGIYTGWIGVLAILKIEFAKTVTLGEVIGERAYRLAAQVEPQLAELVPQDCRQWVPVAVRWTCKAVAISFAWLIQRAVSAFHSAMRGGHLFGKYMVLILNEKGILKHRPEDSNMDEIIGWSITVVGLLFQLSMGFNLPFPLNILLLPVRVVEGFVLWSVAS